MSTDDTDYGFSNKNQLRLRSASKGATAIENRGVDGCLEERHSFLIVNDETHD
jgi:hypothetical protein